uniref:Uncharacterized protein n=1 Tax=Anguilla anguilla TaxID=7936 RepID=A0A0E9V322_ANGAN
MQINILAFKHKYMLYKHSPDMLACAKNKETQNHLLSL